MPAWDHSDGAGQRNAHALLPWAGRRNHSLIQWHVFTVSKYIVRYRETERERDRGRYGDRIRGIKTERVLMKCLTQCQQNNGHMY